MSKRFGHGAVGVVLALFGALFASAPSPAPAGAALPPVTVVVDRSTPQGTFQMAVGQTHTQYSLEASGDAAAVESGRVLLGEAVTYQNQHLYGWGSVNPNPSPGVYDWGSLDRRVQLMRDTGAVPVITLCCAPDWMTELGTETSAYRNRPPTARHYDDFADLARRVAERYPDVRHYVVWNEMKGFWNPGTAQWDYVSYTQMYNAIHDALKGVDPTLQVGGPYLVIESTGSELGGWKTEMPVTRRNRVLLEYWMAHGRGADFVAIDRKVKDYHDTRDYTEAQTMALAANFATVARQVGDLTSLPVWFIEQHFVGQRGGPTDFQAAGIATMLYHQSEGGAVMTVGWKPEQAQVGGTIQENLFTSTRVAGGGQKLPVYWSYRFFNESFSPGTARFAATSSDPLVVAVASGAATVLINQHPEAVDVDLDGVPVVLRPYEVARFRPDGSAWDTSYDSVRESPPAQAETPVQSTGSLPAADDDESGAPDGASDPASRSRAMPAPAAGSPVSLGGPVWLDQPATDQSDRFNGVASDGVGVYVAGSTWSDLDPGRHRGESDAFVRRYDRDGNIVWSNQWGSAFDDGASDVAVDDHGVYAVGTTDHSVAGNPHLGAFDAIIRAYERNGRLSWTRQFGTTGDDHATNVETRNGIVYVTGHTDDAFPGALNAGAQDAFLAAFDNAGNHLWTRQYGTEHPEYFTDLEVDGDALVVSGFTAGAMEPGAALGHWDAFVARLGLDGTIEWLDQFGSEYDDRGHGIAVDTGGIRVGGRAEDGLDGAAFAGVHDGFVRGYTRDGVPTWSWMAGTPFFDQVMDVVSDAGGVHALGRTTGAFPGSTSAGADDVFVATLGHDGAALTMDQWGTSGVEEPASVASDGGRRYVVGATTGTFPGQTGLAGRDMFVAELPDLGRVVAADGFTRNTTNGWGVAPAGGDWQEAPRAAFAATGGRGSIVVTGGAGERLANLPDVAVEDVDLQFRVMLDALPETGSIYLYAAARRMGMSEYRARVRVQPDGTATLRFVRRVDGSWQTVGPNVALALVIETGVPFWMGLTVEGSASTTVGATVWPADEDRPTSFDAVFVDDGNPALGQGPIVGPGSVGFRALVPVTGESVTVGIDRFAATDLAVTAPTGP